MFRIESYMSPYIMGYMGKYIKDLNPANFQMSLWEGEVHFNELNLNLEALDRDLDLPLKFVRGRIHGLHITIPWTKINNEPIQIRVHTMELTLKPRPPDAGGGGGTSNEGLGGSSSVHDYRSRSSTRSTRSGGSKSKSKSGGVDPLATPPEGGVGDDAGVKEEEEEEAPIPPSSYMQNIIIKILNNVRVTFENVIIKYLQDDIVLTFNIQECSYSPVDENWQTAFVDLVPPEFILRKLFRFKDFSVCLDQANNLGNIDYYNEPFLYRCAFQVRLVQRYKSPTSKFPYHSQMSFLFDKMLFAIHDEQMSLVFRLSTLFNALTSAPVSSSSLSTAPPVEVTKTSWNMQCSIKSFIVVITGTDRSPSSSGVPGGGGQLSKLVVEMDNLLTTFEVHGVYSKIDHRVGSFRVRNFVRETNLQQAWEHSKDGWREGKNMGIVMTAMDDISRKITPASGSFNDLQSLDLGSDDDKAKYSQPLDMGSHCFYIAFTKVLRTDYLKKMGVPSPVKLWNDALESYSQDIHDRFGPFYDDDDAYYLKEVDVKLRALDFVFNPSVLASYAGILHAALFANSGYTTKYSTPSSSDIPSYNNTTLPTIYMETGPIRLFMTDDLVRSPNIPDLLLVECPTVTLRSLHDYPPNRPLVSPFLFEAANKAKILGIIGAPVEDRQYHLKIDCIRASTGLWKEVERISRFISQTPSSTSTTSSDGTMELSEVNNPVLTNVIQEGEKSSTMTTIPLFENVNLMLGFAPAIVYEQGFGGGDPFTHFVAGHSFEFSIVSDLKIAASLDQLECLGQLFGNVSSITYSPLAVTRERERELRALRHQCPNNPTTSATSILERRGSQTPPPTSVITPMDFLLSTGVITVSLYHTKKNPLTNMVETVIPLVHIMGMQPHGVGLVREDSQRFELTLFEFAIKLGVKEFACTWLPEDSSFEQELFSSISGERDSKTGASPPFLRFELADYFNHPPKLKLDIQHPIQIEVNRTRANNIIRLLSHFSLHNNDGSKTQGAVRSVNDTASTTHDDARNCQQPCPGINAAQNQTKGWRLTMGQVSGVHISFRQLHILFVEEPVVLSFQVGDASLESTIISKKCVVPICATFFSGVIEESSRTLVPEKIEAVVKWKSMAASSKLYTRSSTIFNSFSATCSLKCDWPNLDTASSIPPRITMRWSVDPMSLFVCPQTILSLLQISSLLQVYVGNDKNEKNVAPGDSGEHSEANAGSNRIIIFDSSEDDLRNGTFRFVSSRSALEFPQVNQVAFCQEQRTMTWRYPQHRVLTSVEVSPVPLRYDASRAIHVNLDCVIEYWDDAIEDFRYFGSFTISQTDGARVAGTPLREKLHIFHATIWRIRIITAIEDADSEHLVGSNILGACVRIGSIHDAALIAGLKIYVEIPRIGINFVNNFWFCGRGRSKLLRLCNQTQRSNELPPPPSLTQFDQTFAVCSFESTSFLLSMWNRSKRWTVNTDFYVGLKILETEFLTMIPVVEPSLLSAVVSFLLPEPSPSQTPHCLESNTEMSLQGKEVVIKCGPSALHTITSSMASWVQVLRLWDGQRVSVATAEKMKEMEYPNMSRIMILNTLTSEIQVHQSRSDTLLHVPPWCCYPFYWTTVKQKPVCNVGIGTKEWTFTCSFDTKNLGYVVRDAHKTPIFIHVGYMGQIQRLITVSGALLMANALTRNIELAVLPVNKSVETAWTVPSMGFNSSCFCSLAEVDHVRFRFVRSHKEDVDGVGGGGGQHHPWSNTISPQDFAEESTVELLLFEENGGSLTVYCVWCTLITELFQDGGNVVQRALIVLSPYFRATSFLPNRSIAKVTPSKNPNKSRNYILTGMTKDIEIDYIDSPSTTHYMTLSSEANGENRSSSSPAVTLVPDIIRLPKSEATIDSILSAITGMAFGSWVDDSVQTKSNLVGPECHWPFIKDDIAKEEWIPCEQPTTQLDVKFTHWVFGLPTILIQFRPWALVVNLTMEPLHFYHRIINFHDEVSEEQSWYESVMPCKSVLSPFKISVAYDQIKLGLSLNGEVVLTDELKLSEEQRKSDIHHINADGVIPIGAFSRLDLHSPSKNQVAYVTLETAVREDMLVIVIRPTFSVINRLEETMFLQCIALSSTSQQARGTWTDKKLSDYYTLPPQKKNDSNKTTPLLKGITAETKEQNYPLLRFCTDFDTNSYVPNTKSVKYLALSAGGPWWIVKLMDFSIIFDNINSQNGILACTIPVSVPTERPNYSGNGSLEGETCVESTTLSILVSWTTKNGQVWISLSKEECPQVVLHNRTEAPFVFVQAKDGSSVNDMRPFQEAAKFEQYHVIHPHCKTFYSFSSRYSRMTDMDNGYLELPNLLLTKLSRDVMDFVSESKAPSPTTSTTSTSEPFVPASFSVQVGSPPTLTSESLTCSGSDQGIHGQPDWVLRKAGSVVITVPSEDVSEVNRPRRPGGTLIMPDVGISWTKLLKVDGAESQYFSIRDYIEAKILIEKVGFTYHIYIENMKADEVAARDVRKRIASSPIQPSSSPPSSPAISSLRHLIKRHMTPVTLTPTVIKEGPSVGCITTPLLEEESDSQFPSPPPASPLTISHTVELHCYLEKCVISLIDDLSFPSERRSLVSLTLEDVVFDHVPRKPSSTCYRALCNRQRLVYTISVRIGDIQVDCPCCPCELPRDFPVVLRQVEEYRKYPAPDDVVTNSTSFSTKLNRRPLKHQDVFQGANAHPMLTICVTIGQSSLTCQYIETITANVKPFYLNIEDRLLQFLPQYLSYLGDMAQEQTKMIETFANVAAGNVVSSIPRGSSLPTEISSLLWNVSSPILIKSVIIDKMDIRLTLRILKPMYLALDQSGISISVFSVTEAVTTSYHLGQMLSSHYTTGAIFQVGNPFRLIGSLELLGSPGTLVGSVTTGLKDLVVYPYQGIFQGPTGFFSGLGSGVTSLFKSITSGTLTSVTNWAWSVSRNLDRLTLDEEERLLTEAGRSVPLEGFTDGLVHGMTSFGIRLLGAIGGLAHHPIQNVINEGPSVGAVVHGLSKGVIGMFTRPIGGFVECVAMTGQGVLRSAGWTPVFTPKADATAESVHNSRCSLLKYQLALIDRESGPPSTPVAREEWFVLLIDATQQLSQPCEQKDTSRNSGMETIKLKPVSLLLSNLNLYLIDVDEDLVISHFPVAFLSSEVGGDDGTVITLKIIPLKPQDEQTFVKQRVMDYVASASAVLLNDSTSSSNINDYHLTLPSSSSSGVVIVDNVSSSQSASLPPPRQQQVTVVSVPSPVREGSAEEEDEERFVDALEGELASPQLPRRVPPKTSGPPMRPASSLSMTTFSDRDSSQMYSAAEEIGALENISHQRVRERGLNLRGSSSLMMLKQQEPVMARRIHSHTSQWPPLLQSPAEEVEEMSNHRCDGNVNTSNFRGSNSNLSIALSNREEMETLVGHFSVSPPDRCEFENVLIWLKRNQDNRNFFTTNL